MKRDDLETALKFYDECSKHDNYKKRPSSVLDDDDDDDDWYQLMKKRINSKKSSNNNSTAATGGATKKAKRGGEPPVWEGAPDEDLEGGWPDGWVKKLYARKNGATKGTKDRYWFTPVEKYKLRSMNEVKRFMAALQKTDGDEKQAKSIMNR